MALFSKRSTHSIDALPKSLRIGVLSSFGGKAPLVLANTSSTGNYDCRFLQRMRTRDVCLEPRVRYSIGSQKYEFFSSMLHKNDKASKNQSKDKEARCSKAFSARSYRKGVYIQQCISTKLLLPNSPKQAKRRGTTRRNPWQLPEISHQVRLHSGQLSKWKSKRAYQSRLQNWKMFLSKNFTHRNQNHLSCLEPTLSSHIDNESAQRY